MRSLLTLKVSIWFKSCWWRIIHRRSSSTSAKTNCSTKTGRWLRPKGSSGWLSPTTASSTRAAPTSSSWAGWSRPTGRTSAPRRKCRKITQPSRAARVCPSNSRSCLSLKPGKMSPDKPDHAVIVKCWEGRLLVCAPSGESSEAQHKKTRNLFPYRLDLWRTQSEKAFNEWKLNV